MSEQTVVLDQRVAEFAAQVRTRLADLTAEEREELAGDLEADLAELVAERGPGALGDPAAYAAELRAAAGFGPETARRPERRDALAAWLDRGTATWTRWSTSGDHLGVPALATTSLRPVWWVLRGLCAAALVVALLSPFGWIHGFTPRRALLALVLVAGSVALGRAWVSRPRLRASVGRRLLLGALNVLAVVLLPVMADRFLVAQDSYGGDDGESMVLSGLAQDGREIHNVFAYDADGEPLTGVQLVDQDGEPITVVQDYYDEDDGSSVELTPWRAGLQDVLNVFPLAERRTDNMTGEWLGEPALPEPPLASLPSVALDGVTASRQATVAEQRAVERLQALRERLRGERARDRAVPDGG